VQNCLSKFPCLGHVQEVCWVGKVPVFVGFGLLVGSVFERDWLSFGLVWNRRRVAYARGW
jgi:hypothetical protein